MTDKNERNIYERRANLGQVGLEKRVAVPLSAEQRASLLKAIGAMGTRSFVNFKAALKAR